jgi:hypothetical protein
MKGNNFSEGNVTGTSDWSHTTGVINLCVQSSGEPLQFHLQKTHLLNTLRVSECGCSECGCSTSSQACCADGRC